MAAVLLAALKKTNGTQEGENDEGKNSKRKNSERKNNEGSGDCRISQERSVAVQAE